MEQHGTRRERGKRSVEHVRKELGTFSVRNGGYASHRVREEAGWLQRRGTSGFHREQVVEQRKRGIGKEKEGVRESIRLNHRL